MLIPIAVGVAVGVAGGWVTWWSLGRVFPAAQAVQPSPAPVFHTMRGVHELTTPEQAATVNQIRRRG